jgi:hypothetical protein
MNIKKALREGRVVLTDLRTGTLHGSDPACPLKMTRLIDRLERGIATLEAADKGSLLERFKDLMIDSASDREKAAAYKSVIDLTYQLRLCSRCLCANCAAIVDRCRCQGCLYGSRVVDCSKLTNEGIETRVFEPGVAALRGEPLIKTEFDRHNHVSAVTVRQANGLERRFLHPLEDQPLETDGGRDRY